MIRKKRLTSKIIKEGKGACERKKHGKMYFGKEAEEDIISFIKTKSKKKKDKLFVLKIMPVFSELIDNLIKVYKVGRTENNLKSFKDECLGFMYIKLCRGNFVEGESRAFSYFNVVCRNFIFNKYKEHIKKMENELSEDNLNCYNELDKTEEYRVFRGCDDTDYVSREIQKEEGDIFLNSIYDFKNNLKSILKEKYPKKNEINLNIMIDKYEKVVGGISEIFKQKDNLPAYKKKVIYFLIREMVGVDSKIITEVIDLMKNYYPQMAEGFVQ